MSDENKGFWSYLRHRRLDYFPPNRLRWWLLIILVFAWTVEQFERAKISPVLSFVLDDFDVSLRVWGYVSMVAAVLGAIGAILFSVLADKYGRKPLMIWPIFLYIFIAAGTALAPNFATLAALYILGAVVVSGMLPAVNAATRDISPRMGRALSYSFITLAYVLGALSSNLAGAFMIPVWPGWRPQFWLAAVVAAACVLLVWIFYKDLSPRIQGMVVQQQSEEAERSLPAERYASLAEAQKSGNLVFRDWRIWVVSTAIVFWSLTYATIVNYVPLYLHQYFGMEEAKAAGLTAYGWLMAVLTIFLSGWLSDKLQVRKTITIFGGVMTGVVFFLFAGLPSTAAEWVLVLLWCLVGFFAGMIYPAWCALLSENAESISPFGVARAFGITGVLGVFSGVFLHLGLPIVVERWGWTAWMAVCGVFCLLIATTTGFGRGPWWVSRNRARLPADSSRSLSG